MAAEILVGNSGPPARKLPLDGTVLIVGAGEAGVAAAAALRDNGFVGRIVLVSGEAGIPYQRPPLSKEQLKANDVSDTPIRSPAWYCECGIELIEGRKVTSLDPVKQEAMLDGGQDVIFYNAVLIATGARARVLASTEADVHYLRTREDAARLRRGLAAARSMIVVGAGVIGLEVASVAIDLGIQVTVIDPSPRLMQRALAPEISGLLADLHRESGVSLYLQSEPIALAPRSGGGVALMAGSLTLAADICVAGIGVIPNDMLAQEAGCVVDNGVVVDGRGQTNVPGIYAAGDVAAFHHPLFRQAVRVEAWQHAGRHGAHVARAMLGIDDDYVEVPWFWTDQLGANIQVAGMAADCDQTIWRGDGASRTAFHFKQGKLRGVTTLNNGRDMRPSIKLLAAGWSGMPSALTDMSRPLGKLVTGLLSEFETS